MVHFTEISKTPPPYSMLHDVGREAMPKLATRNCCKLANNIDNEVRGIGLRIYVRYCLKK